MHVPTIPFKTDSCTFPTAAGAAPIQAQHCCSAAAAAGDAHLASSRMACMSSLPMSARWEGEDTSLASAMSWNILQDPGSSDDQPGHRALLDSCQKMQLQSMAPEHAPEPPPLLLLTSSQSRAPARARAGSPLSQTCSSAGWAPGPAPAGGRQEAQQGNGGTLRRPTDRGRGEH